MDDNTFVPVIDATKMAALGVKMGARFDDYKKDRRAIEEQWLRNLRQVKGIYDPEILAKIPPDQSTTYPKVTRTKVYGTVARLMEMLFPQTEKNWAIKASPMPDLSQGDLQTVLTQLQQTNPQPSNDDIENAIIAFAGTKAERMEKEIEDQLDEIEYITLARKVVFSGTQYSIGILKGPLVQTRESRTWAPDPLTQQLTAKTIQELYPVYESCSVWDWYPDVSAKTFDQMDGQFQRHIMSRNQVHELAKRADFDSEAIKTWLAANTAGNYKELWWETELRVKADRKNITDLTARKYEIAEWWGFASAHDLKACGIEIPDDQLSMELEANIWTIGNIVIKAKLNPYDAKIRPYHIFVYEDDDLNLTGSGMPQVVRDSQLGVCEAARMILDNGSVVCRDMVEVNTDLLVPGQNLDIYAGKAWLREGTGQEAALPAVKAIKMDGHIPELKSVVEMFMEFADTETALPPPALGDPSKGGSEALRTTGGMSMLMGAAALPIRDTVRNFDRFTTSFITSLYNWNMQFSTNQDIKGDATVIARGSTSLIAKEVRANALTQFSATLTPEEHMHIDTRKMLVERIKAHDIPLEVLVPEAQAEQQIQQQAQQAQQDKQLQDQLIAAQVKEAIAAAFKDISASAKNQAEVQIKTFDSVIAGIESVDRIQNPPKQGAA